MPVLRRCFALTAAAVTLLSLSSPRPAHAWGAAGHAMIAMMAYRQLTPTSRAQVDTILKSHPDYQNWLSELPANTPEDRRGEYIFAVASTWPDRIRGGDPSVSIKFFNSGRSFPQPVPADPAHYPELDSHGNWHYSDTPINADGKDRIAPATESAMTAIPTCEGRIGATSLPLNYRAYYLAWLIHLVGDIHQPLHAVSRFSVAYPKGDQGGNAVRLAEGGPNNLHSYWDGLLGNLPNRSGGLTGAWDTLNMRIDALTTEAVSLLSGYDPATRDSRDETRWKFESFTIARETVYDIGTMGPDAPGPLPQPGEEYHQKAVHIAHQRALLAAHRLALVIDDALSEAK